MTLIPLTSKIVVVPSTTDTTERKSTQNNALSDVYTVQDVVDTVSDNLPAAPTTTVVNISSAQILSMGSTPIELLPAAGVGKYYDIEKIILEFDYGTTQYTTTSVVLYFDGAFFGNVNSSLITAAGNQIGIFSMATSDTFDTGANVLLPLISENSSLTISTWDGDDPTLGDGTMRAIITYTTRTFGA